MRTITLSEKVEQATGVQLLRTIGAKVYVSGTRRRKGDFPGTMQTPGIPDVEAWLPSVRDPSDVAVYRTFSSRVLLKWEVKRVGGRLSPEQQYYQALCQDSDVPYVVGPCPVLIQWLIDHGYVKRGGNRGGGGAVEAGAVVNGRE